jgi:glutamate 5-kinase
VAQTLLTRTDLQDRVGYLNARNAFLGLLDLGVIPIVNENDVVAVEELENGSFGDNDSLSAMVANLVDADLLALLSDIRGLYTADPRSDPDARHIPLVPRIDTSVEALAGDVIGENSRGGMAAKLRAAKTVTSAGIAAVIADGREPDVLLRICEGEAIGTLFLPVASRLESRKRWMRSGLSQRGAVIVDDGAVAALVARGGSLLAAGVHQAEGRFHRGDIVAIRDLRGETIGYGLANYSADELARIKGLRSSRIEEVLGHHYGDEVVHRNNFVLI